VRRSVNCSLQIRPSETLSGLHDTKVLVRIERKHQAHSIDSTTPSSGALQPHIFFAIAWPINAVLVQSRFSCEWTEPESSAPVSDRLNSTRSPTCASTVRMEPDASSTTE